MNQWFDVGSRVDFIKTPDVTINASDGGALARLSSSRAAARRWRKRTGGWRR